MRKKIIMFFVCFNFFILTTISGNSIVFGQDMSKNIEKKLLNRIDFGSSYIMGQSIASGAVYLLQRKKSKINTMLKLRNNYRKEILSGLSFPVISKKESNPVREISVISDYQMEQYVRNFK